MGGERNCSFTKCTGRCNDTSRLCFSCRLFLPASHCSQCSIRSLSIGSSMQRRYQEGRFFIFSIFFLSFLFLCLVFCPILCQIPFFCTPQVPFLSSVLGFHFALLLYGESAALLECHLPNLPPFPGRPI